MAARRVGRFGESHRCSREEKRWADSLSPTAVPAKKNGGTRRLGPPYEKTPKIVPMAPERHPKREPRHFGSKQNPVAHLARSPV